MDNTFIAPVANPGQSGPNKLLAIVGIIALLVVVAVGFFMILGSSGGATEAIARANERLKTQGVLVANGQDNAESASLRKIVAESSLLVKGDIYQFSQAAANVEASEKTISEESEAELLERLSRAAINGQFDSVYVPALIEKYEATIRVMSEVQESTDSQAVREAATRVIDHNDAILSQLRQLNL